MAELETQPMTQEDDDSVMESQPPERYDKPWLWGVLLWVDKPDVTPVKLGITKDVYKIGRAEESDCLLTPDNCSIIVTQLSRTQCIIRRSLDMVAGYQVRSFISVATYFSV